MHAKHHHGRRTPLGDGGSGGPFTPRQLEIARRARRKPKPALDLRPVAMPEALGHLLTTAAICEGGRA